MPLGPIVALRELYDKKLSRKVVVKIGKQEERDEGNEYVFTLSSA